MPLNISLLRKSRSENSIHYFPSIDSTMIEASRLAESGAPHGTVVIADEQTAGVGRLGRSWVSKLDLGIYCSVLLRLPLPPAKIPIANLLLGLSVAEAIQKTSNLVCDLRWPNDVLINERKVCGILTQLVDRYIVAGIGLNVNHNEFEAGFRTPPTSLRLETGFSQAREPLVLALLESIDSFCKLLQTQGSDAILRIFSVASSYVNGRRVTVEDGGRQGVTAGLDDSGFLMLRAADGQLLRLSSGGIRATTA